MPVRAEFSTSDIPWPKGVDSILRVVSRHRRARSSVGSSVALGIVEESHDFFRDLLRAIPQTGIDEAITGATFAGTVASYYARPAYALLCAEEFLRSRGSSPAILLPDETIANKVIDFFTKRAELAGKPTPEPILKAESDLTVIKAERLIINKVIAEKLPGMEPPDFVLFAFLEEIRILNRMKGLNPGCDQSLRFALINGSARFSDIYDYAVLLEP